MKKFLLLLLAVILTASWSLVDPRFENEDPPKTYPIWHYQGNGEHRILHLPEEAARNHLANHPEDFCHPRACPPPIIIPY